MPGAATFVLIPGAGGSAFYWHLVEPELRAMGHEVVAADLPASDDSAGLTEYCDAVVEALENQEAHPPLVVVAQSMGGFTGPMVCQRLPVDLLVLLNSMVPRPGESPGDWWVATGHGAARAAQAERDGRAAASDIDVVDEFFHDVPDDVRKAVFALGEPVQSDAPFGDPWPLERWPEVTTRVLKGRDDRFFPPEFQRRVAEERLGITPDEMPGGHLVALSRPVELARRLDAYWVETRSTEGSQPDHV